MSRLRGAVNELGIHWEWYDDLVSRSTERFVEMPDEPPSPAKHPKKKFQKSQLRVAIDTNALYVGPNSVGSASDLVRQEIASLIVEAKYPDLDIRWFIPEIVRHERQYQMQSEALKLRSSINKIERLLGHNLALTNSVLLDHVRTKIDEKEKELGLEEIKLDHSLVDWPKLIHAAAYRSAPFEAGEKEKGFRDALVAESFLQLLTSSPKTPSICRVVLITSDTLLAQAVTERITDSPNASVLADIEELKGLINTIVSNVGEDFIAQIKPKAQRLFFVSREEKETVYYREKIREKIKEKFEAELEAIPQGTTFRENGTWYISPPNFSHKDGRRIHWTTRIAIEMKAGATVTKMPPVPIAAVEPQFSLADYGLKNLSLADYATANIATAQPQESNLSFYAKALQFQQAAQVTTQVISHEGRDIFEVLWSTEVTVAKELKKVLIDGILHVELNCQPV